MATDILRMWEFIQLHMYNIVGQTTAKLASVTVPSTSENRDVQTTGI